MSAFASCGRLHSLMKSTALQIPSYDELLTENALLRASNQELQARVSQLEESLSQVLSQLDWFKRQVFGKTSEKFYPSDVSTLPLFAPGTIEPAQGEESKENELPETKRRPRGKTKPLGNNGDSGLRFDDNVEIITEDVFPDEAQSLSKNDYEIVDREISDRVVSRKSRRVILRRVFHKIKIKPGVENPVATIDIDSDSALLFSESAASERPIPIGILKSPVPKQVIDRSYMAVSFLVDMVLDKILYSLPLFRQHQSLTREGFHFSRSVLTKNFIKTCEFMGRIVEPLKYSVIAGSRIAIDETPMKVGVDEAKHKMNKGYVWPIYGELNEIVYHYNESRGASVIGNLLGPNFKGTVLSDGYPAYNSYMEGLKKSNLGADVVHATCWIHARRKFVKLQKAFPDVYSKALGYIGALYDIETSLAGKSLAEIAQVRLTSSLQVVDDYFIWLKGFSGNPEIARSTEFRNALSYSIEREHSMREFLKNPSLELDTNHLEREIRPIAIGRKNWLFCWTEVGAESLCAAQSLVRTCLLQGVDPRTYLIDVLQRLTLHRADDEDVSDLIPRLWKDLYGMNPIPCPCEEVVRQKSG